ncbi:MAG: helix-turn-helix domain-containing protein [Deltaproteobacteria bacterium]|jgi:transcriptional regulator with XRE-family HTH domain|nr:helix-turn-helix domain-containing protein [Deltaproteobacteria bacterium]
MLIDKTMSDAAILAELGARLARRRIDSQLTQADLAREAGISKRTVERIEAGGSAQMASMIRIFRVLDVIPEMDQFIPPSGPRPMDLIKNKGKQRQRASSSRKDRGRDAPWTWKE